MAEAMTYASLLSDVQSYAERNEAEFVSQIPRFVMNAENRIASEARGLGFYDVVTGNLETGAAGAVLAKPARWRETVSFQIGTGTSYNTRVFLRLRPYEFLRAYWSDQTQTEEPKYYADYNYDNWLIAGSPDLAYPFEIIYHQRPPPLDATTTTNWTTQYAPQLILYACLLEAQPWLKNDGRIAVFEKEYDRALKQVAYAEKRRESDRAGVIERA